MAVARDGCQQSLRLLCIQRLYLFGAGLGFYGSATFSRTSRHICACFNALCKTACISFTLAGDMVVRFLSYRAWIRPGVSFASFTFPSAGFRCSRMLRS